MAMAMMMRHSHQVLVLLALMAHEKINLTMFAMMMITVMTEACRKANGEDLEECEKEKLVVFGETK